MKIFNNGNSEQELTAKVLYRGQPLGTWRGTSYEYSELIEHLKQVGIDLIIIKRG